MTLHALHAPRTRLAHQEHVIDEADSITSLSLSSDSRHVLVNTASEGIHSTGHDAGASDARKAH